MMCLTGCYCRALLLQAALREETQRLAEPIMRLPQAVATALPLTDVAAALQGGSAPPALLGADAQEDLRSIVRAELQGMAAQPAADCLLQASQPVPAGNVLLSWA